MSDRVCIMHRGRIAQIGTPEELYDQPQSRYVADFIGRSNFLPARALGHDGGQLLAEGPGGLRFVARAGGRAAGDGAVTLSLRPEEVRVAREDAAGEGHEMRVTHRIFLGEHVEYHLRSAALDHLVAVVPRSEDIAGGMPGVGAAVRVAWRDGAALALAED